MGMQRRPRHRIDFLFPLMLFFLFAATAASVILMAAGIYQSATEDSLRSQQARTALTYISEKIHQNDQDGKIYLTKFEDLTALAIRHSGEKDIYYTYIYSDGTNLRELFLKEGAEVAPESGSRIAAVADFSMEELRDGIFCFRCLDENGESLSQVVCLRSREGGQS